MTAATTTKRAAKALISDRKESNFKSNTTFR